MTIQKSEHLNELFAALSKLQGKIEKAKKDQSGYENKYKFADLSQYIDLSQDLLAEHGLLVMQLPDSLEIVEITKEIKTTEIVEITKEIKTTEIVEITKEVFNDLTNTMEFHLVKVAQPKIEFRQVKVAQPKIEFVNFKLPKQTINTWIGHESGQFISGPMDIIVEKIAGMSWGQSTGSAITYGRRYSRAGALGMTQEDDDNQNKEGERNKNQSEVKKISGKPNPKNEPQKKINHIAPKVDPIMAQNLAQLLQGEPERLRKTLEWANASKIEELTVSQYETVIRRIEEDTKAKVEKAEQPAKEIIRTVLDTSQLIADHQVNFIKRLVTPERLLKVLQDYKLTRLEEMTIKDFNALTDALRIEATPATYQPKPVVEDVKPLPQEQAA
jgi:hypothetical protein